MDWRDAWYRGRGIAFLITIGVLLVFQVVFDIFSNFVGGGMTMFADVVLGGIVVFLSYKAARPPLTLPQWGLFAAVTALLAAQFYSDWKLGTVSAALIIIVDILSGLGILLLVYRMPQYNRVSVNPLRA